MTPLIWAILLLALGVALLLIEMFVPSAGVLGFLAATAILGSILLVYAYEGIRQGTMFFAAVTVLLPILGVFLVRLWPKTPIGRRVLNISARDDDEEMPVPGNDRLSALVGKHGLAKSKMLPSGAIEIDGKTFDAVSQGVPIERGEPVEVVQIRGNQIVVRPLIAPMDAGEGPVNHVVQDPFDESLP